MKVLPGMWNNIQYRNKVILNDKKASEISLAFFASEGRLLEKVYDIDYNIWKKCEIRAKINRKNVRKVLWYYQLLDRGRDYEDFYITYRLLSLAI